MGFRGQLEGSPERSTVSAGTVYSVSHKRQRVLSVAFAAGMFKETWERSDSKQTFAAVLQEKGFLMARGDKRGFVILDVE